MAEQIGIEIYLGMDSQELQSELQKAENQLRQFESQLKKSTNTIEISMLNKEISTLQGNISNMKSAMDGVAKPTADATQSLVNLSRIAQDAPYGFMGIANNLNPMLESFQRLQKDSEKSGGALKAMVAGLTGPAGLGLALGVVSSLLVKFGGDISDFFTNLTSGKNTMDEYLKSINESQKSYVEAYTNMYKLKQTFEDYHKGLVTQKEVLSQYNNVLGDTYGKTNDVAEAERVWEHNSGDFIKAAVLRAAAMLEIEKAAKKSAEAFELSQKPKEQFTSAFAFGGAGVGGASALNMQSQLDKQRKQAQDEAVNGIREEEKFHLQVADNTNQQIKLLKDKADLTQFIGKELPKEVKLRKENVDTLKEESAEIARMAREYNELTRPSRAEKRRATPQFLDLPVGEDLNKKKLDDKLPSWFIADTDAINKNDKAIKEAYSDYRKFAQTLSSDVTNGLMSAWDAMQKGEEPLQALGQMFEQIALQIAAMVIQATIFAAILEAFPALKGAFATVGAVMGVAKFADGGIVSQPTIGMVGEGGQSEAIMPLNKLGNMLSSTFNAGAMSGTGGGGNGQFVLKGNDLVLALQRSNYSLNLRRGA